MLFVLYSLLRSEILDLCRCVVDFVVREENINFLKKIVVKVVFDVMVIMEDIGVLIKLFEDIFEYGKIMLFIFVGDDIDVDILSVLWLKNWNVV